MKFVRGDSFLFKVLLTDKDCNPIKRTDVEELYVTFRKYANDDYPILFQKSIEDVTIDEDGYLHVAFLPGDTEELSYGQYCFDIEVTLIDNYRKSRLYTVELTKETTIHRMAGDV